MFAPLPCALCVSIFLSWHRGSAESHECLYYQMKCDNGCCIDKRRQCDTRDDCGDGSDEQFCGELSSCDCHMTSPAVT